MPEQKKLRPLDAATLWQIERLGGIALAPDGRRAVCVVSSYSTEKNEGTNSLWLLPTDRAAPSRLTTGGAKDGQPAWSPLGDRIAFVARREQQGVKDETAQLYVIAADGGEARRVSRFAPGVESFRWLPDGRRIVFAAWVWPDVKGSAAQARRHKEFTERKETGYATSEAFYRFWDSNLPMGRVLHLHLLDVDSGRVSDLFEGTAYELPRQDPGRDAFDVRPDGRRVVFVHDPASVPLLGNALALAELDLRSRRIETLLADPAWEFSAPRYAPDGRRVATLAANIGRKHTALAQLALVEPDGRWSVIGAAWDRQIDGPLAWSAAGDAVFFAAEDRGRRHLWRFALDAERPAVAHEGGWVGEFGLAADTIVVAADSALHPVRVLALRPGAKPLRLERFNDALLRRVDLGEVREVQIKGAGGEPVQMWLTLPPGFDAKKKHALTQVIHGGPFSAAGDSWGYRWNPHVLGSRGHVIAQVNFHGSSGFGFAFRDSLIGRQGELELQDIEAGTDWLLKQRWVDGKRLFAAGGSYGGFLVAWMNGHLPAGRYRAYVCHAGVFDRIATFSADSYPERPKDLAARYWEDMPRVLAQSPATFAAAMTTPTLVIHGARDYRVPDCNGLAYYNTLKARGIAARLLWFPDENHWVLKPRNSLLWYREFLDWIEARGSAVTAGPKTPAGAPRARAAPP